MKKAVIEAGGKQFLVSTGDELDVPLRLADDRLLRYQVLLSIDGDNIAVGSPTVEGKVAEAEVIRERKLLPKVTAIRFKAKKRVSKRRGHRQAVTRIKITSLAAR